MRRSLGFYPVVVVMLLAAVVLLSARYATGDVLDATVRIFDQGGGPRGTGTVFADSGGKLYISTCEHVVEGQSSLSAEFYRDGYASKKIPARIVLRGRRRGADGAVLTVPRSAFGQRGPPRPIPWAKAGTVVQKGDTILSVGCANGAWATLFRGHVTEVSRKEGLIYFIPAPAGGRSGSAIFNKDGSEILGILFARVGGDTGGIATSVDVFYWLWYQQQAALDRPAYTPCSANRRPLVPITQSVPRLNRQIVPPPRIIAPPSVVAMPISRRAQRPPGCRDCPPGSGRPQAEPDPNGENIFPGLPWGNQARQTPQTQLRSIEDVERALEDLQSHMDAQSKANRSFQSQMQAIASSLLGEKKSKRPQPKVPSVRPSSKLGTFPWEMTVTLLGSIALYFFMPAGIAATALKFALPWMGKLVERGFGTAVVKRINDPNDLESNQAIEVIGALAAKGANGGASDMRSPSAQG